MKYVIGDTIRLKATIKNLLGIEEAPASVSVSVCNLDGTVLLAPTPPNLIEETIAQYYYDWTISTELEEDTQLAVIWEWSGPHKKKMLFKVIPIM
ncbi:hypothetical protein ES708_10722 [subsurface metagenome]